MKFASMIKARPVRAAVLGIAMVALGGLPAFADTPYRGARDVHAARWLRDAVRRDRRGGCEAQGFRWFRFGRRDANACATFTSRDDRFGRHRGFAR